MNAESKAEIRKLLTCTEVHDAIVNNRPKLPANERLEKALQESGLDGAATLIAIAYKESGFNSEAENSQSSAKGLYQFLAGTADDIQDRVVKNFLNNAPIPNVPAGKRFTDYRTDPAAAAFCAWAYLLDRIAAKGNKLKEGIIAFGDGTAKYATDVFAEVKALRTAVGSPADKPTDPALLKKGMNDKCKAIKEALDKALGRGLVEPTGKSSGAQNVAPIAFDKITFTPPAPRAGEEFEVTVSLRDPVDEPITLTYEKQRVVVGDFPQLRPTGVNYFEGNVPPGNITIPAGGTKGSTKVYIRRDAKDSDTGFDIKFPDYFVMTWFGGAGPIPDEKIFISGLAKIEEPQEA